MATLSSVVARHALTFPIQGPVLEGRVLGVTPLLLLQRLWTVMDVFGTQKCRSGDGLLAPAEEVASIVGLHERLRPRIIFFKFFETLLLLLRESLHDVLELGLNSSVPVFDMLGILVEDRFLK